MMEENSIKDKAYRRGLVIVIILLMLLVFTSIVLAQTLYGTVAGNTFTLGTVKIDLGYYVDIETESNSIETKGPFWTKSTDQDVINFIKSHALVNNNSNPEEGEVSTDEVFKAYREGDEERYDIITRKISVKNDSNNNEYYRLYFSSNLNGKLYEYINVKIIDVTGVDLSAYEGNLDTYKIDIGNNDKDLLFNGFACDFISSNVGSFGELPKDDGSGNNTNVKTFLIRFTYPSDEDLAIDGKKMHNEYQYSIKFDLCAEAVQIKNQNKDDIKFN